MGAYLQWPWGLCGLYHRCGRLTFNLLHMIVSSDGTWSSWIMVKVLMEVCLNGGDMIQIAPDASLTFDHDLWPLLQPLTLQPWPSLFISVWPEWMHCLWMDPVALVPPLSPTPRNGPSGTATTPLFPSPEMDPVALVPPLFSHLLRLTQWHCNHSSLSILAWVE